MTDAPLPSPAGSHPASRSCPRDPSRPDLRLSLLEAIHHRDGATTKRLAERWVHRRGLVSLEAFQRITLANVEGSEACRWLQQQLNLEPPPALTPGLAAALGPEIRLHDCIRLDGTGLPFVAASQEPLPSVEEAFAALAAEFSMPPMPARPVPLAVASPRAESPEGEAVPGERPGEEDPWGEGTGDGDGLAEGLAEARPAGGDNHGFPEPGPGPKRRFSLGRVRSLVRDCLEEAIGTLRVSASSPPEETLLERAPTERAPAALATPQELFPLPAPREEAFWTETLPPPPTFRPSAAILASPADPPLKAGAEPGLPRWLPRLGPSGPSRRPAPAPADLADLRAWLPDDDDLPRAC